MKTRFIVGACAAICAIFVAALSAHANALTLSPQNVTGMLTIYHDITDCPTCHTNVLTYVKMPRGNFIYAVVAENVSVDDSAYHYNAQYAVPDGWPAQDYAFTLDVKRVQLWEEYNYEERFRITESPVNEYTDGSWKTSGSASDGWQNVSYDDSAWSPAEGPFAWSARWYDTGNADWRWDVADQDFYVRKSFTLKQPAAVELRSSSKSSKECYVNGQKAGGAEFEDITALVNVGKNVVACHAKAEKRQASPTSDYECYYSYSDKYNTNGNMNCDKSPYNIKCENPQNCFVLDEARLDAAVIMHGPKDVFWNDGGAWYVNEMPISSSTEYQTVARDTYGEFSNGEWHSHAYAWPTPFDSPTRLKKYFVANGSERLLISSSGMNCSFGGTPVELEQNNHNHWNLKARPNVTAGLNVLECDAPAGYNTFDAKLVEIVPINVTAEGVLATAGMPFSVGMVADGHTNATIYAELYDNETLVDAAAQNVMLDGPANLSVQLDPHGLSAGVYGIMITAYDEDTGEAYFSYATLLLDELPVELPSEQTSSSGPGGDSGASPAGGSAGAPAASAGQDSFATDAVELSKLTFSGRTMQNFNSLQQSMDASYRTYLQMLGSASRLESDLQGAEMAERLRVEQEKQKKLFEELAKADSENYYDAAEHLRELAKGSYSYDTKQELLKKADELDAKATIIVEYVSRQEAAPPMMIDAEYLQAVIEKGSVTGGTVQYAKNNAERGQGVMEVWGDTAYGLADLASYAVTNPAGLASGVANAAVYAIANPADAIGGFANGYYARITEGGNENVIEGRIMGEAAMIVLPMGIIGDAGKAGKAAEAANAVSKAQLTGKITDYPFFENVKKGLAEYGVDVEYNPKVLEAASKANKEVKSFYGWDGDIRKIVWGDSTSTTDFFHELKHFAQHMESGFNPDILGTNPADILLNRAKMEIGALNYEKSVANAFGSANSKIAEISSQIDYWTNIRNNILGK